MMKNRFAILLVACVSSVAFAAESPKKQIEVCFVLDTTGSMSGLIEGAKSKIWSIANDMLAIESDPKNRPSIKFALVGYRDRGDDYITRDFDLTDDLDAVFKNLSAFSAGGGGDTPESVNQALDDAVTKIHWSEGTTATKIIFLVGDAPPHMDYPDDVKFTTTLEQAVKQNVIVNTVQCGSDGDTTHVWKQIATLGEGKFVQLAQTGDMVVIATPYDEKLAAISNSINETVMNYGDARQQADVSSKMSFARETASAAPAAAADRMAVNAAMGKSVQGRGDLIDDLADGHADLAKLKDAELPKDLQGLPREEQLKKIAEHKTKRDELRKEAGELSKKRQDFIEAERKKSATSKDSFDQNVADLVREQVKK